jgi:hypothetical protein
MLTQPSLVARLAGAIPLFFGSLLLLLAHKTGRELLTASVVTIALVPLIWFLAHIISNIIFMRIRARMPQSDNSPVILDAPGPSIDLEPSRDLDAWERYGFARSVVAPRLAEVLPEDVRRRLQRRRMAVDIAVSACTSMGLLAVASAVTIRVEQTGWFSLLHGLVALYAAVLAIASFVYAKKRALAYDHAEQSAVDLYYLDFYRKLGLQPPVDPRHARYLGTAVSQYLSGDKTAAEGLTFEQVGRDGDSLSIVDLKRAVEGTIESSVKSSVQDVFARPKLVRFDGWVVARVTFHRAFEPDGRAPRKWDVVVDITRDDMEREYDAREVLRVPGVDEPEVTFTLAPESETLIFGPSIVSVSLLGQTASGTATFVAHETTEQESHDAWINVSQGAELVQVVRLQVHDQSKA